MLRKLAEHPPSTMMATSDFGQLNQVEVNTKEEFAKFLKDSNAQISYELGRLKIRIESKLPCNTREDIFLDDKIAKTSQVILSVTHPPGINPNIGFQIRSDTIILKDGVTSWKINRQLFIRENCPT